MKKYILIKPKLITEQSLARVNEIFIGYFSLDDFNEMKYRSKRLDKSISLKGINWYAVYVNRFEWDYIPPKKYKLKRK